MKRIIYILCCTICIFLGLTDVAKAHTLHAGDTLQSLDGEWMFYHEQLMAKGTFEHGQPVHIPSSFESQVGKKNTYGTYIMKWDVPKAWKNHKVAVHIPFEYSAYAFYVDGKKLAEAGTVGGPKIHETMLKDSTAYFTPSTNTVVFAMEVSSFQHIRGGFENSIKVSHAAAMNRYIHSQTFLNTILTGVIFMMGIMMLLFALFLNDLKEFFVFGLFCISFALRSFFAVPFIYADVTDISYEWGTKMEYFWTLMCFCIFIYLMRLYYTTRFSKWMVGFSWVVCGFLMIATLFTEPVIFQALFFNMTWPVVPIFIYLLYVIVRSLKSDKWVSRMNAVGSIIVFIGVILDYLKGVGVIASNVEMTLVAVTVYLVLQVGALAKDFARSRSQLVTLNEELVALNTTLDQQVAERTLQLSEANEQLRDIAWKDGLTNIYNRRYLSVAFEEWFNESKSHETDLSVVMIDIDKFKQYNDYYGHIKGDELLVQFTQMIARELPTDTLFARYGGEEFIVVVKQPYDMTKLLAEHLRQAVEEANIPHLGHDTGIITASFGIATYTNESQSRALIDLADSRLYEAKAHGRNSVY